MIVPTPFDWAFTPVAAVEHLINTDFSNYFQLENLIVNNNGQNIKDRDSGILIQHYFGRNELGKVDGEIIARDYSKLVDRFERKVQRFRALLKSDGPSLYVLMTASIWVRPRSAKDAAVSLRDTIRRLYPAHKFCLVIVRLEEERESSWGESDIVERYVVNGPKPWNGEDASWDRVFQDLNVKRHLADDYANAESS